MVQDVPSTTSGRWQRSCSWRKWSWWWGCAGWT